MRPKRMRIATAIFAIVSIMQCGTVAQISRCFEILWMCCRELMRVFVVIEELKSRCINVYGIISTRPQISFAFLVF